MMTIIREKSAQKRIGVASFKIGQNISQ